MKKGIVFTLFLLVGIIAGCIVTELTHGISFLEFLSWGKTIGVGTPNPIQVDLVVFRMQFGFSLDINVGILLCVITSLVLYNRFGKEI